MAARAEAVAAPGPEALALRLSAGMAPGLRAYALLDGARRADLPGRLFDLGAEAVCLQGGRLDPVVAAVSPWLVALPDGATGPVWDLATEGLGAEDAVLLLSPLPPAALRRALRALILVTLPDGDGAALRLWDPRVLGAVMPVLTDEQRARLAGAASLMVHEDPAAADGVAVWRLATG
jgi:hypothetical protein